MSSYESKPRSDNTKITIFNSVFSFIQRFQDFFCYLEYLYETTFIPEVGVNGKFELHFSATKFVAKLSKSFITSITKKRINRVSFPKWPTKRKSKVVHFIVYFGVIGGASKLIFDIIRALGEKYAMEVIILSDLQLENYPNLKLHHFTDPLKTVNYLVKTKPDIIHAYYYGDWEGFHSHFDAILSEKKIKSKIAVDLLVPVHMYRSPRIDEYVYVSKYVKDMQHKHFKNERVIYFGVDTNEFLPAKTTDWKNAVGMVYRLWNDKLDQSTIELFIKLAERRPNTLIYIIGEGINFHHYVNRTRQCGVRNNFYFTGTIDYKQVDAYYEKFDIFVAPVHTESFGVVVPNAMSKNMPVVAYRRGALPEILGRTNSLVNTSNEMVNELIYLLDHPKVARKISSGGRKRAIEIFSNTKMIEDYDTLYQDLLKR